MSESNFLFVHVNSLRQLRHINLVWKFINAKIIEQKLKLYPNKNLRLKRVLRSIRNSKPWFMS